MTTAVFNEARLAQITGGFCYAFAANAQRICNKLLSSDQFVGTPPVKAKQEPTTELLVQGVMAVAYADLRHLGQQRHNTVVAHHGDFCRRAIFKHIEQGYDRSRGKIDIRHLAA